MGGGGTRTGKGGGKMNGRGGELWLMVPSGAALSLNRGRSKGTAALGKNRQNSPPRPFIFRLVSRTSADSSSHKERSRVR